MMDGTKRIALDIYKSTLFRKKNNLFYVSAKLNSPFPLCMWARVHVYVYACVCACIPVLSSSFVGIQVSGLGAFLLTQSM